MTVAAWVADRAREFAALRGRRIERWQGVEMALRDAGPQFTDPACPFLQLHTLRAHLAGTSVDVGTYQDDTSFGLWLRPRTAVRMPDDGSYRARELPELPAGPVDEVDVRLEGGTLAEVRFAIGGRPLLLVAGEVYEDWDKLRLVRFDESVLAFTDPAAADELPWEPSRTAS